MLLVLIVAIVRVAGVHTHLCADGLHSPLTAQSSAADLAEQIEHAIQHHSTHDACMSDDGTAVEKAYSETDSISLAPGIFSGVATALLLLWWVVAGAPVRIWNASSPYFLPALRAPPI